MRRRTVLVSLILAMHIGLPLLGVALAGKPLTQYLEFPPLTRYVDHPPFSWGHFIVGFLFLVSLSVPFTRRALYCLKTRGARPLSHEKRTFPWWGWAAVAGGAISWVLAWNRFPWFEPFQSHTFTPLWISYIIAVNAYSYKRGGKCMLVSDRGYLMLLFLASTVFWWVFEFLNRFVQNWYYPGGEGLTSSEYVLYATISFSTVLPAVLSTKDLLLSFPFFRECYADFIPLRPAHPKVFASITLLAAALGLVSLATHPELTYSFLWLSPLIAVVSFQVVFGKRHVLSGIASGDWTLVITSSVAALVCGFFWEMWNYYSLSKWVYAIPYLHKFQLFEMPLLGYAGYLPFGLICLAAGELVRIRGKEK
ncbi:MAG: hypothetical protein GTN70_02665 [Deltaproteobacteria bacterium]|nr:hypothetical protein [Deltaproteobacteria bacterium]